MSLEGVVAVATGEDAATDLVALDEALIGLTRIDPRKTQIVEMRFFGGLTVEDIGEVLDVRLLTHIESHQRTSDQRLPATLIRGDVSP